MANPMSKHVHTLWSTDSFSHNFTHWRNMPLTCSLCCLWVIINASAHEFCRSLVLTWTQLTIHNSCDNNPTIPKLWWGIVGGPLLGHPFVTKGFMVVIVEPTLWCYCLNQINSILYDYKCISIKEKQRKFVKQIVEVSIMCCAQNQVGWEGIAMPVL